MCCGCVIGRMGVVGISFMVFWRRWCWSGMIWVCMYWRWLFRLCRIRLL